MVGMLRSKICAAIADLGIDNVTWTIVATRGTQLILARERWSVGQGPEAFSADTLKVVEIDADRRMVGSAVQFDVDDMNGAFAELDSRYLAGEAAEHAHTWSVIARNYAAFNRHEFPSTTPDWVTIDHRRATSVAPDDLPAFIRSVREDFTHFAVHIEAVHRLSELGAVITQVSKGTSHEGFEAEWRELHLCMIDGEQFTRSELFDESDLDAALRRFDELSQTPRRLENAASRVEERFNALFAARDWAATAELLADDTCYDDRRRVINAGTRRGRDIEIANLRALVEIGAETVTSVAIATRGERLALSRVRAGRTDHRGFYVEALGIIEIDTANQISAHVWFDLDDIDAAFAELDTRYLAGEAAIYARTWSLISEVYAGFNRREIPATSPNWASIDHRHVTAFAPGELAAFTRATWQTTPDIRIYVEAAHGLSDHGAVLTTTTRGTSLEGFAAESREICIMTFDGDLISRCELFDDTDLDAAITTFDELDRLALENGASRVADCFWAYFAVSEWDAMAELLANEVCNDDRRPIVGSGFRRGRVAQIADVRAIVNIGITTVTSTVIAIRGDNLVLRRTRFLGHDQQSDAVLLNEILDVVEIDDQERIAAIVMFALDDVDDAFEELENRYFAGEAAQHAATWSVIKRSPRPIAEM